VVDQTTPREVTDALPSADIFPPLFADVVEISETFVVEIEIFIVGLIFSDVLVHPTKRKIKKKYFFIFWEIIIGLK
jgi:membrane protein CcdC involved in cytochrome C biogenesis